MKTCTNCKVDKTEDDFRLRRTGSLFSHCKQCDAKRKKAWALANPGKMKEYYAKYASANREQIAARARSARADNPERNREACRRWRTANGEKARAARAAWYAANPAKARAQEAKRRAAKLNAFVAWADTDLIADIYAYASIMRSFGIECHVDHIVPLQGRSVCGLHVPENLTVIPAAQNIAKGNRFIPTPSEV